MNCSRVVDVGAGQGYLARTLAFCFGLHVTAVEREWEFVEVRCSWAAIDFNLILRSFPVKQNKIQI